MQAQILRGKWTQDPVPDRALAPVPVRAPDPDPQAVKGVTRARKAQAHALRAKKMARCTKALSPAFTKDRRFQHRNR